MSFKPTVEIEPDDVIRYLLYQQFYYGEDRIFSRTKDRFEQIDGAGEAIEKFYLLITQYINLINKGQIEEYLEYFNLNVYNVPKKAILDKYNESKNTLGSQMNAELTLTVILGECLSEIHKECFEATLIQLISYIIEKKNLKSEQDEEVRKKIESLYSKSNSYIGMIYSLSFMKFLADKVKYPKIVEQCQLLLEKYFSLTFEILYKN